MLALLAHSHGKFEDAFRGRARGGAIREEIIRVTREHSTDREGDGVRGDVLADVCVGDCPLGEMFEGGYLAL